MITEAKSISYLATVMSFAVASFFLQSVPTNIDSFLPNLLDKGTTIGILVYIAYSLNKKLELVIENFKTEERSIREQYAKDLDKILANSNEYAKILLDRLDRKDAIITTLIENKNHN